MCLKSLVMNWAHVKTDTPMDKKQVASLCKALRRNKKLSGLYLRSTNTPHQSVKVECLDFMNGTMNDCAQAMELKVKSLSQLQTMLKTAQASQHLTCAVCWHLAMALVVMDWLD